MPPLPAYTGAWPQQQHSAVCAPQGALGQGEPSNSEVFVTPSPITHTHSEIINIKMQNLSLSDLDNLHVAITRHPMCVVRVQICIWARIRGISNCLSAAAQRQSGTNHDMHRKYLAQRFTKNKKSWVKTYFFSP